MPDDNRLKPGVEKPTRWQYLVGAVVIILASVAAYWWLGHRR